MKFSSFAAVAFAFPALVQAQLSGTVGPLTSTASKRTKVCNVLNYGGVASLTADIGPPIASAFAACKTGGTVYVPPGTYGMSTWVTLNGGSKWAFQLDGVISRVGTGGGNMIFIEHTSDFEFYSSTSGGAIQGNGVEFHKVGTNGPRLLRTYDVKNFSIHDIALVDSPLFHLVLDDCFSGELYNMVIYGHYKGGLDAIDIWGGNIWVHDIEVTNKDECVTVKSPAHNMLIEDIYCNISGGCAIGSLGAGTDISDIHYRNVYTHGSNQMMMIKSYGGSGTVKNVTFESFIGHSNAYSLDFNAYWTSMTQAAGSGVEYSDISFIDWTGTAANGVSRAPIYITCPADVPCTDVVVSDFEMWTDAGSSILYKCANAYGSGGCLQKSTGKATGYATVTQTVKTAPTGYSAATLPRDLKTGYDISSPIPIPTVGTTYFPGATPISKRLGNGSVASSAATSVKNAVVSTATSTSKKSTTTLITSQKATSTSTSTKKSSSSSSSKKTTTTTAQAKVAAVTSKSSSSTTTTKTLAPSYTSIFTTFAESVTIATTLDASVSLSLYGPFSTSSLSPTPAVVSVVTQVSVVTVLPVAVSTTIGLPEFTSVTSLPVSVLSGFSTVVSSSAAVPMVTEAVNVGGEYEDEDNCA